MESATSHLPRALRLGVVIAIAALVIVLLLAFRRDPHDIRTGTVGKPSVAMTLPMLDGTNELTFGGRMDKVIVVNFFASWCIPCKEENPALVRTYERYRTSGVIFVGVLYQDSLENGRNYVTDNGVTWPTAIDTDGRVAFSYGVFGIPETYFIGPDGIIAGRHIGPIDENTLATAIDCLRATARSADCMPANAVSK